MNKPVTTMRAAGRGRIYNSITETIGRRGYQIVRTKRPAEMVRLSLNKTAADF
ncbi:hypothetical protein RFM41_09360 [Mesorhizobium sp. VK25A]|uniref:Uncharacterized protein n=1 Tax=Mesorhizobium vachelliae TaxID=3072309 RepID=A0ABU5A5Z2_9HYPH|nr:MULTISPECIES: hypothetical protein [unclassified Mesorhizobium]MDX8531611.1 hypothetical protein [Mesorhizobium sp. VK25D]MDX8543946.1 hypothetical protein [Mesorhizobium sp. VK25A]